MAHESERHLSMPAGAVPQRSIEPYRWFLKSSLLVAITAGWLLGAVELSAITFHGVFGPVAARVINLALFQVHGQSQIVGWVGLFIMGIAYQVIPRQRRVALHTPTLAFVVLGLLLAGIALRAISQPLAAGSVGFAALLVLSALVELSAVTLFVAGLVKGRVMAESIQGPERFSRAGLQWYWLALLLNLAGAVYLAFTRTSVLPAWIDRPILDLELFGFVTFMVFGVNARNLPLFMSVKPAPQQLFRRPLWLLGAGTTLAAAGSALASFEPTAGSAASAAGWLVILAAAVWYAGLVGLLRPRSRTILPAGRSGWYEAYVLAAYAWLAVGLCLGTAAAALQTAAGAAVADDLYLAALHAITVGFISTMIMGMAARIVPAFAARQLHSRGLLIATWLTITAGTLLRVPSQALYTLAGGPFVPLLGLSGLLQLAALVLFGTNLWLTLA
ncbi:MAG: NnrS family protein [Chloroflexota bacterium]|nr:NnrS family protein [Chloroflexota bacterium]